MEAVETTLRRLQRNSEYSVVREPLHSFGNQRVDSSDAAIGRLLLSIPQISIMGILRVSMPC